LIWLRAWAVGLRGRVLAAAGCHPYRLGSGRCDTYQWRKQYTLSSPGSPAAARASANRSSTERAEIRSPTFR
jgi:hypothetical protein